MATGLAFDRVGRGSTVWTAGPQTAGYQGRLRLIADQAPTVRDDLDEPFLVTNGGNHYYVNDSSATGDVFTTAVGNNANTGKSPSQPMATLAAPLDAYDLDPGDIVHVDTGHYDLLRTLLLARPGQRPANRRAAHCRGRTGRRELDAIICVRLASNSKMPTT